MGLRLLVRASNFKWFLLLPQKYPKYESQWVAMNHLNGRDHATCYLSPDRRLCRWNVIILVTLISTSLSSKWKNVAWNCWILVSETKWNEGKINKNFDQHMLFLPVSATKTCHAVLLRIHIYARIVYLLPLHTLFIYSLKQSVYL